ncbi:GNAT family N-acetyltransferase [Kribbella sp. NPDC004536]|uniref:GNAT family N-acetyltransferase n=1 Tax=Kribbella sp. NPDC004536 TaxID=3364106 RepID=UPI003682C7BD
MIPLDDSPQAVALRTAYDQQIRTRPGSANGGTIDRFDALIRKVGFEGDGFVQYLGGADGPELDQLIADQVAFFRERGVKFEWKYYTHDLPADLPERLTAAGLVPDEEECLLIGDVAELQADVVLPDGIRIREITERADLERMQAMEEEVWGYSHDWLPDALSRDLADADEPAVVIVAETDEDVSKVVCGSWIRFHAGTEFASLWGGSTLAEWRGKGIYRAHVAYRRNLAVERGYRYLQVDASPDSRGILARLGLRPVSVTIPYIWKP